MSAKTFGAYLEGSSHLRAKSHWSILYAFCVLVDIELNHLGSIRVEHGTVETVSADSKTQRVGDTGAEILDIVSNRRVYRIGVRANCI